MKICYSYRKIRSIRGNLSTHLVTTSMAQQQTTSSTDLFSMVGTKCSKFPSRFLDREKIDEYFCADFEGQRSEGEWKCFDISEA